VSPITVYAGGMFNVFSAYIGKHFSFPIQYVLKQADTLSPLLISLAFEYAIRKVKENEMGLKLSVTHQLLA
jgi:hypothetical protein